MSKDKYTLTLTHSCYAGWHVGQRQRYLALVCSEPASEWSPRCDGGSWAPLLQFDARCSWSPRFPLPLWSPLKGCMGDVTWLSSQHKSDTSPLPLRDDGTHAVFVAEGEKMLVRDGLEQEYLLDSSKVLGVEGGQFVLVAFWAVQ